MYKEIADKLAVELAYELQHKPNKPKRELISESESYKRNKTKYPLTTENTLLHQVIINNTKNVQNALKNNNHKLVRKLAEDPITRAAWHLMKDKANNNLLISAIYSNHLQSVKALVENGFDINMPNHTNQAMTPLIAAVQKGNDPIIQYLLNLTMVQQ